MDSLPCFCRLCSSRCVLWRGFKSAAAYNKLRSWKTKGRADDMSVTETDSVSGVTRHDEGKRLTQAQRNLNQTQTKCQQGSQTPDPSHAHTVYVNRGFITQFNINL